MYYTVIKHSGYLRVVVVVSYLCFVFDFLCFLLITSLNSETRDKENEIINLLEVQHLNLSITCRFALIIFSGVSEEYD